MDTQEILAILDQEAKNFVFPMLDNGYVYPAAARLSLYRSSIDWAVVFENFGYSPRAGEPDCTITTFASRLSGRKTASDFVSEAAYTAYLEHNRYCEQQFVQPIEGEALYDVDCAEFVAPGATRLRLRGQDIAVPDRQAIIAAGIEPSEDRLLVFELTRYLAHHHRELVLAAEAERTAHVPKGVELLGRYDDWRHPDLVNEEWPSDTASFRAIAAMLAGEPYDEAAITAEGNTHWSNWPEGGTL
ncbi:MAG: hypothetical protein NWP98_05430 [Erythrobacter sp.]|nr:hypothetical protein [Erythrobacter sp.]